MIGLNPTESENLSKILKKKLKSLELTLYLKKIGKSYEDMLNIESLDDLLSSFPISRDNLNILKNMIKKIILKVQSGFSSEKISEKETTRSEFNSDMEGVFQRLSKLESSFEWRIEEQNKSNSKLSEELFQVKEALAESKVDHLRSLNQIAEMKIKMSKLNMSLKKAGVLIKSLMEKTPSENIEELKMDTTISKEEINLGKESMKTTSKLDLGEETKDEKDFKKTCDDDDDGVPELEDHQIDVVKKIVDTYAEQFNKEDNDYNVLTRIISVKKEDQIKNVPPAKNKLIKIRERFRQNLEQEGFNLIGVTSLVSNEDKIRNLKIACSNGDVESFTKNAKGVVGVNWAEMGVISVVSSNFPTYFECFKVCRSLDGDTGEFFLDTLRKVGNTTSADFVYQFLNSDLGSENLANIMLRRFSSSSTMQKFILKRYIEKREIVSPDQCRHTQAEFAKAVHEKDTSRCNLLIDGYLWDHKSAIVLTLNSNMPELALSIAKNNDVTVDELAYKACVSNLVKPLEYFLNTGKVKNLSKLKVVAEKFGLTKVANLLKIY